MQSMSTRRLAVPLRVHQIWDGITRASTGNQGPVEFERLMQVLTTVQKLPRDEMSRELERAIKDQLVVTETIQTRKFKRTEIYKLPDPEFLKGDHDWYCFHCHLGGGGPVVTCENCPRIFHMDCLTEERKAERDVFVFVCPPCQIVATKPSAGKLKINQNQLNTLLQYSCTRLKDWLVPWINSSNGVRAFASSREAEERWRFNYLVYFNIDLTLMMEKASSGRYTSLEEYQVDCETLAHAIGVYSGNDHLKGVSCPAAFRAEVMHEIEEITLCHDCFRRSNENCHLWWFCLPCTTPHEVVWAKHSGYPYWPAKVKKIQGSKYDVCYFGGKHQTAKIDVKNIRPISTPLSHLRIDRRTAAWTEAFDELKRFQDIARDPALISSLPTTKGGKSSTPAKGNAPSKTRATGSERHANTNSNSRPAEVGNTKVSNVASKRSKSLAPAAKQGRKSTSAVLAASPANSSVVQTVEGNVASIARGTAKDTATASKRPSTASTPAKKLENKKFCESDVVVPTSGGNRFESVSVAPAASRGRESTVAVLSESSASSSVMKTNAEKAKKAGGEKSSSTTPRKTNSGSRTMSMSPVPGSSRGLWNDDPYDFPDVLDADDIAFLYSLEHVPVHNYLHGDAHLPDEEVVSENAGLSLVNANSGNSVSARTSDVRPNGRQEGLNERVVKYLASFKERHAREISKLKKKQWCFQCKRLAVFHCCWNTAYCSVGCQEADWKMEHKHLCHRNEADK